jgi:hypothetical protein
MTSLFVVLMVIFLFWLASVVWFIYSFLRGKKATYPFFLVMGFAFLWFIVREMVR